MAATRTKAEEICPLSRQTDVSQDYNYKNSRYLIDVGITSVYFASLAPSLHEDSWMYAVCMYNKHKSLIFLHNLFSLVGLGLGYSKQSLSKNSHR